MNPEVSIIMPLYNNQVHIKKTINSVLSQTFENFEIIVVDDCSEDNSVPIVQQLVKKDPRIKIFQMSENNGAALARNAGLKESKGRYIAYLDADDLWEESKLEKQISFMKKNNCGFSCTSYEVIDNEGKKLNKEVRMKKSLDYKGFLTNNLLQTVGIMADTNHISKNLLIMPNLRRRQDAATWLQILRDGHKCYGLNEVLGYYRRVPNSLSSNKFKAAYGVWYLYREVESLPLGFSLYIYSRYVLLAIWKRMYWVKNK